MKPDNVSTDIDENILEAAKQAFFAQNQDYLDLLKDKEPQIISISE